jgi:hypothetical protein
MVGKILDVGLEGGVVQLFANVGDPVGGAFAGFLESLLLFGGDDSLLVDGSLSLLLVIILTDLSGLSSDGEVGVQPVGELLVLEWVLLLALDVIVVFDWFDDGLDFVRVDDSADISVAQDGSVEGVVGFLNTVFAVGSEDLVQRLEGGFGPDDQTAEGASWGELLKVESVNVVDFNAWDVSDGLEELDVLVGVDEEWATTDSVSSVSDLATTSAESLGVGNSFDVLVETEGLKEVDDLLGLLEGFNLVIEDEWELTDLLNTVTTGEDQWSLEGGGEGGGNSVTFLGHVDLTVPSSPGLEWGEHATLSAHVTEGTLTGSGGTGTTNSWNTCDGTTWLP